MADRAPQGRPPGGLGLADVAVLLGVSGLLYAGVRLAVATPEVVRGPDINLAPSSLPWYALLSSARMAAAYALSMAFSLGYGYAAARSPRAEGILLPILDVLQSVPILSFLPVVVLALLALLPERAALELGAIVLIFTSQVWNLTFSFYQSLKTVPGELGEASRTFGFGGWLRFRHLEVPFAAIGLIWNSMMSWAGGWFFLMASEIFVVGQRDFRLPGLGSYLQKAASLGDTGAILWGLAALVLVIGLLDQLLWRPVQAWSERFKLEMVAQEAAPASWAYDLLSRSLVARWLKERLLEPGLEAVDAGLARRTAAAGTGLGLARRAATAAAALGILGILYLGVRSVGMMLSLTAAQWAAIGWGALATLGRVAAALLITLAWTVPVGVALGVNARLARLIQPVVQLLASIPATALFPVILLLFLRLPGGLELAAILLMLLGTQWYVLFNVIAGARAIPQDLKDTTATLGIWGALRWRTLTLPAIFPYLVTGMLTASGGSWNASIVAEYVQFGGRTHRITGLGAVISGATDAGDYRLLLSATVAMIVIVVCLNRFLWRRLYRLAAERFRLE